MAAALLPSACALAGATFVQAAVVSMPTRVAVHERPVVLECWQNGRRIVTCGGLSGLAVKAVTRKRAVVFKPIDGDQPEIFLLPFADSLCLIGPKG